jgi:23S rRNA (adenine2030-N6)-methyltransferase
MNYRHAFHAGNHGDVLKHALLARVLNYLTRKEAPLAVLDAHAGIGRYDLSGPEALKTSEWRGGIGRLLEQHLAEDVAVLLEPYLAVVRQLNPDGRLNYYPGSPLLAQRLLRSVDRLQLNELHPQDHGVLAALFAPYRKVQMTCLDAAQAIKSALPFPEKRGLVLIDPAFEVTDESQRVSNMLVQVLRRMAQACVMIWYPVTTQSFADAFCDGLNLTGAKAVMRAELRVRNPETGGGLAGSGVVIVNPPWLLFDEAEIILPALATYLGEDGQGAYQLSWLVQPT